MLYIVVLICFSFQDFKVEQVVPFMSEEPTSKFFMFWTGFVEVLYVLDRLYYKNGKESQRVTDEPCVSPPYNLETSKESKECVNCVGSF